MVAFYFFLLLLLLLLLIFFYLFGVFVATRLRRLLRLVGTQYCYCCPTKSR